MAGLQRTTRRLTARRQQRLLAGEGSRFAGLALDGQELGSGFGAFALLAIGATLANYWLGKWFDGPPPLGPAGVMLCAGAGATAWLVVRAAFVPALRLSGSAHTRAIAAAVERALAIEAGGRAQLEELAFVATRAWAFVEAGAMTLLLVDCGDATWVGLRGPVLRERFGPDASALPQRFVIERLRWTGALLTLGCNGPEIALTRIEAPALALPDAAPPPTGGAIVRAAARPAPAVPLAAHSICQQWDQHELPVELAAAIGQPAAAYR